MAVRVRVGNLWLYVNEGARTDNDINVARIVIEQDEYRIKRFLASPERHEIKTVVDIGANIGAFSVLARHVFPQATIISVEPEGLNFYCLTKNCNKYGGLSVLSKVALSDDEAPSLTKLSSHQVHSGGCFIDRAFEGKRPPFQTEDLEQVITFSAHRFLSMQNRPSIDFLKVDTEGSEVAIFSSMAKHGWLEKTRHIAFEWHGHESIPQIRELLAPTHDVVIDENAPWNALGFATRKVG